MLHETDGSGTFDSQFGSRFNSFLDNDLVRVGILYFTLADCQHVLCADTRTLEAFHVLDLLRTLEPSRFNVRLGHLALEHCGFKFRHLFVAEWSQELGWRFCTSRQLCYFK